MISTVEIFLSTSCFSYGYYYESLMRFASKLGAENTACAIELYLYFMSRCIPHCSPDRPGVNLYIL